VTELLTHLRVVENHPSDLLKGICKIPLPSRGGGAAYVRSFSVYHVLSFFSLSTFIALP
jgi:hypothetical protein